MPTRKPSLCRSTWPNRLAATVLSGLFMLFSQGIGIAASSAGEARSASSVTVRNTITLTSQTSWVAQGGTFSLGLKVGSPLPASSLGIEVIAYSQLPNRTVFERTLTGKEQGLILPGLHSFIRLRALGPRKDGPLNLHLKVLERAATAKLTARTIPLNCSGSDCDGVYPVVVTLVDTRTNEPLASLTTHLVYAAKRAGAEPLRVALVLPLGVTPSLGTNGRSALSNSDLHALSRFVSVLQASPGVAVTLNLHPQLLTALTRPSTTANAALVSTLTSLIKRRADNGRLQLLDTSFVPLNLDGLVAVGLGGELQTQIRRAQSAFQSTLGMTPSLTPWIVNGSLSNASLPLLAGNQLREVVLPTSSLAAPTFNQTPDAPFDVTSGSSTNTPASTNLHSSTRATTLVGLANDTKLDARFDADSSNPVLAAHQFLAELAQTFFELPFGTPRGVVVAPTNWNLNATFLTTVLKGLASSPILATSNLSSMFNALAIGANGEPTSYALGGSTPARLDPLTQRSVAHARKTVQNVNSVDNGRGSAARIARLNDALLISESAGLGTKTRERYLGAANNSLATLGSELSFAGTNRITLTSLHGKVPITVKSSLSSPLNVLLELKSSKLAFNNSVQAETIDPKDNPYQLTVSTRTSGESPLTVELVAPRGGAVLLRRSYTVVSTAFSGVAIAISLGALAVLLGWWIRSFVRHRRRNAREHATAVGNPAPSA